MLRVQFPALGTQRLPGGPPRLGAREEALRLRGQGAGPPVTPVQGSRRGGERRGSGAVVVRPSQALLHTTATGGEQPAL